MATMVFTALSAVAASVSSYLSYMTQDAVYKSIVLNSQIDTASSVIADGQRLTIVLDNLANLSDSMLPLQDKWLSVHSGQTRVTEAEFRHIQDQMKLISDQMEESLSDLKEAGQKLHQNLFKIGMVFPIEIWRQFNDALMLGNEFIINGAVVLRTSRRMLDSLVRQDATSMRNAQAEIVESREAIRRNKERVVQMQNSINIVFVNVRTYLDTQRFSKKFSSK